MRAAVCASYGSPEHVFVSEIDPPALGPGEARIRVHAAAVNFPDVLVVADKYQLSVPVPFTVGSEMSGTIIEVADDVEGLEIGDLVTGTSMVGAFAEEAVVGATAINRLPAGTDLRLAAAFGVAHRTAYHVLRSVGRVQPGDELVVLGAGGGVGLAAVQLGAQLGATVTAVASSEGKLAVAAQLGASRLIDHRTSDLRQVLKDQIPGGTDVVVDPVGGSVAEPALRSLHYGGRFVTVGYASGEVPRIPLNLVLLKGIEVLGFQFIDFVGHHADEWARNEAELLELFVDGRAAPYIGAAFPLEETAAALRLVADGQAVGKVVIEIGS